MERGQYCYRFGTAEFDESRCELKVAGLPVEAERRVLDVLVYLLQHAGEVVTKDELLRTVWAGRITVEKVLPNAMTKLRRALGAANAQCITTQARIGYRLDGPVTRTAVVRQPLCVAGLAVGQTVPGRENFALRRVLGAQEGSEVWLAEHCKTREPRVYKFALDGARLRSLQREATLLRVLQDSEVDPAGFAGLIDWNFEQPPYFLECQYGGPDLQTWCARHLQALDAPARIALFLQMADAVAAAHAVGVLHKDLKPANVLVEGDALQPHVRLTDFGSGRLLDPDRLQALGISRMGLSTLDGAISDSDSGTPLYVAPEVFAGQVPTVQSDVYALGVLLYQLLSDRLGQPMAPGWEHAISDPLLREDLRRATDGNPARRMSGVAELAQALRALPERRQQRAEQDRIDAAARVTRAALARVRARRPYLWALLVALSVGLGTAVLLQQRASRAYSRAEAELARANAVSRFLDQDLISRANPLVLAHGADAPLREVLLAARDRLHTRFQDQPLAEASIRASLARQFTALDLFAEGEQEARRAVALYEAGLGADAIESLALRALHVHLLSVQSRHAEAAVTLQALQAAVHAQDPRQRHLLAKAQSSFHFNRGAFTESAAQLRMALATLDPAATEADVDAAGDLRLQRDTLRVELIVTLGLAGDYAAAHHEAEALLGEVATRAGDHRLLVAMTQVAMARSVSRSGDTAGAIGLLQAAQPVLLAQLGPHHSRYLGLLNEWMAVSFHSGDYAQALLQAQALDAALRARFGDAHRVRQVSRGAVGQALYELGRYAQAAAELQPAHAALVAALGAEAPQTQDLAFTLAAVQMERGDGQTAAELLPTLSVEVLQTVRAARAWTPRLQALRGLLQERQGQRAAALALLRESVPQLQAEADASRSQFVRSAVAALQRLQGVPNASPGQGHASALAK